MKQTISKNEFIEAFKRAGRGEQFSREALSEIFDWITSVEQDTGEETELDVVEVCCNWTEYETAGEAAQAYGLDSDNEEAALRCLSNATTVLECDGGSVVVLNY